MSDIPFEVNEDLMWKNPTGWVDAQGRTIVDKGRWTTYLERVITDGSRYFRVNWSEGNTEYQDPADCVEVVEVWPKQVMTTVFLMKKDSENV
jgi:hypothetical protein